MIFSREYCLEFSTMSSKEEIIQRFRTEYPNRNIFTAECKHPRGEYTEEGYAECQVADTKLCVFAVESDYTAMDIAEFMLGLNKRTLVLVHTTDKTKEEIANHVDDSDDDDFDPLLDDDDEDGFAQLVGREGSN